MSVCACDVYTDGATFVDGRWLWRWWHKGVYGGLGDPPSAGPEG